ncbi:MAG TPA: hypothetical protein VF576_06315, partial [Rubricoccaceae bacterium]
MNRLLFAALVALLAPAVHAQTCTTSWTNAAGGSWETPTNWSDGVPDSGDTACITLAGTYTVSQSSSDRAVAGLVVGGGSGVQTLTTFNAFSVTGNSFVRPSGRWELLNRTPGGGDGLYTTGTVLVEGVFVQNGGTTLLDGGGTFEVAPAGRWEMRNQASAGIASRPGTYRLRGTLDASYTSTQNVNLPLDVQGGTVRVSQGRLDVAGGVLANATLDAAAGTQLFLNSTSGVAVSGTLSGAPAGEVYANGGTFAAAAGGATLAVGGRGLLLGGSVRLTSSGGAFLNTGLLVHAETGSNFAAIDAATLRNEGRFVMPGRGFGFANGGVVRNEASGTIEIANGGGLGGVGGSNGRVVNAGLIVHTANSGGGTGTTGTVGVPYDGLPGSVLRTETGRLDLTAGGALRDVSFDVPAGTTLILGNSAPYVVSGTLSGTPVGTLYAQSNLAAGPGGATLAVGGTGLQLTGSSTLTSAGGSFLNTGLLVHAETGSNFASIEATTLRNEGRFFVGRNGFGFRSGGVVRNEPGGTVEFTTTGSMGGVGGSAGRFENAGLLLKSGPEGTSNFTVPLVSVPGAEYRSLAGRLDLPEPPGQSTPAGVALTGTGQLLLPANHGGSISPGTEAQPVAALTLVGRFAPSLTSGDPRLVIDVAAGGVSDRLDLSAGSTIRLGGTLVVRVRPGYVPRPGDLFTILSRFVNATDITGQFSQILVEGAPAGIFFAVEINGNTAVQLRAVSGVTVEALAAETAEDGAPVTFVVRSSLPAPPFEALSVPLAIEGTARRFDDFVTDFSGTVLRIAPGETEARVTIFPLRDALAEGDETVTVRVVGGGTALPGTPSAATVRLRDAAPSNVLAVAGIAPSRGADVG